MLTRRLFATCALCALTGFTAEEVAAQGAPAGFKRKILRQTEGPMPGYVTVLVEVEIASGAQVARHTHPGIESAYVLEGTGTLSVQGKPDMTFAAGDGFVIEPETPHAVQNGSGTTRVASTYIVEKGKPLASPAPA